MSLYSLRIEIKNVIILLKVCGSGIVSYCQVRIPFWKMRDVGWI